MLNPNNDRLDYGQILAPPAGFYLDFAVGTTYSLNLDALVGASLSLGLSEETDSELMNNPVCLLEALRSVGDKVALFCESGQIQMPTKVTSLYVLLEKIVFTVKTAKRRGIAAYPSFHPKFWLIKYKNSAGEYHYRVIVLSRNLTFDRSWDVAYYMDGKVVDTPSDKNEPVCDFLRYLLAQIPSGQNGRTKAKAIKKLINELPCVEFQPPEKEFYDFEFIPNGVKKVNGEFYRFEETKLFTDTFQEILIISPFLSGKTIRSFNNRNERSLIRGARHVLITREMSLGKLSEEIAKGIISQKDICNFKFYTMRDKVVDGETAISEDTVDAQKQDIHAKVYMIRKYSDADLYLGSLNASRNAVYGNVEFMLRLCAKNRYLNLDKLMAALFGSEKDGSDNPFQEVTLENAIIDEDDKERKDLDSIIKAISRSRPSASVRQEEDYFAVTVHFGDCDIKGYKVDVRPLLSKKEEPFGNDILFSNISLTQLSEFYSISVSDGQKTVERVLVVPTAGLPEDREKAVVSSVVSNKDCFYRYIAFLLGDDSILSILESKTAEGTHVASGTGHAYQAPALYEKMLQTAASAPEKFKGIEYLMKTLAGDEVVPDDFKKLYQTFKKVVKLDV